MKKYHQISLVMTLVTLSLCLNTSAALGQASFQGLGDLPGGEFNSIARDVSGDGSVVVGRSVSGVNGFEAFKWTAKTGLRALGILPDYNQSQAAGVSPEGSTIVGWCFLFDETRIPLDAFRWTAETGIVNLADERFFGSARDASLNGLVVAGEGIFEVNGLSEAFTWTAENGIVRLGVLPTYKSSGAISISSDGSVVVGTNWIDNPNIMPQSRVGKYPFLSSFLRIYTLSLPDTAGLHPNTNPLEAFRWTAETGMVSLGDLPGGEFTSDAWRVSADGSTVVGRSYSENGFEAFRWTAETGMVGLGILPGGKQSVAIGVSKDGSVIVGYSDSDSGIVAFIWDTIKGMRSLKEVLEKDFELDLTDWTLEIANAVSDDGTIIVGGGTNPQGKQEAWRAVLRGCFPPKVTTCPDLTTPNPDSDLDGLKDEEESVLGTDPCNPDTDGDGLLDSWEADPTIFIGAGFDVDADGMPDVTRDEVFGPYFYQTTGEVNPTDFSFTDQYSLADKPNPLHKDVYLEMDWLDCKRGGCFKFLMAGDIDPNHHAPDLDALRNVRAVFDLSPVQNPDGRSGIRLHIIIDEGLEHAPNCDQDESFTRLTHFGTVSQRLSPDIIQAKKCAFRYAWAGHSTRFDYSPTNCPTPKFYEALLQGLGCSPLPDYDYSPFGSARIGGRDILISPSPLWVCSETSVPFYGLLPTICFRIGLTCDDRPTGAFPVLPPIPGIFPADVKLLDEQIKTVKWPMNMLLGIPPQEGVRQFWGRALMHLLGHSLGIADEAVVRNDPNLPGTRPPDSYASWENLQYAPGKGNAAPLESFPDLDLARSGSLVNVQSTRDLDGDGISDDVDNCPWVANPGQSDLDGDGFGDTCDGDMDGDQIANGVDRFPLDFDNDGIDNAVDEDDDGDGIPDMIDNCLIVANSTQTDTDGDGIGDACDSDDDNDGIPDLAEQSVGSLPTDSASQPEFVGKGNSCADGLDNDLDGRIDEDDEGCKDTDGDSAPDFVDSCPKVPNEIYQDRDGDGIGDDCDPDDDNDNIPDLADQCLGTPSGAVVDSKGCSQLDVDADGDGICNPFSLGAGPSGCTGFDNCPNVFNPDQADTDGNGIGDACENIVSVELVSFTSQVERNDVTLRWVVAIGSTNSGFEIQRSTDNTHFEKIGFVTEPSRSLNNQTYSFIDHPKVFGVHYYRLKLIDIDGSFNFSGVVQTMITPPDKYELLQNYPNPFNPETIIRFAVPTKIGNKIHVILRIYDLLGQLVRTLVDEQKVPGYYNVVWDGRNDHGSRVSSGLYLYLMTAGDFKASKSMVVLK